MSETVVLVLTILIAAAAMLVSVALSLARGTAPAAGRRGRSVLPMSVPCPATGDVAQAKLGYDWASGELAVTSCERFPTGDFECDRECFPTRRLTPVVAAA
ncbi:MAG TPA: hypothetical protein VN953_06905 [Gemmatimonadales bacterium]|nr:hypothetical protein [Gemmatimonadales bacterium]